MTTAADLRIGDAEREAAVASLREHFAEGRLTLEEFNQRMDAAFAAKTQTDLARITADLPHSGPGSAYLSSGHWKSQGWDSHGWNSQGGPSQDGTTGRARQSVLSAMAGLVLIAVGITAIIGLFLPFGLFGIWTARPLVILVAMLAFGRRILRRFRGGPPVRNRRRR